MHMCVYRGSEEWKNTLGTQLGEEQDGASLELKILMPWSDQCCSMAVGHWG